MRLSAVLLLLAGCAPPDARASFAAQATEIHVASKPAAPEATQRPPLEAPAVPVDGRLYATQWRLYFYVNQVRVLREIRAEPGIGSHITELKDDGCPVSLEVLAAPNRLTVDAWNHPLTLTCDPATKAVLVASAGPDGAMGTPDDLSSAQNPIPEQGASAHPPSEQLVDASCRYLARAGVDTIACGAAFNHSKTRQGIAECSDLIGMLGSFAEHANWTWQDRLYPQEYCRQGTIYIPELVCMHQFKRVADAKLCSVEHASHWQYFEKNIGH